MKRRYPSFRPHGLTPSCTRRLRVENLERRLMLAGDVAAFQNPLDADDVNNDKYVTPRDALMVINLLNAPDSRGDLVGGFIDVNDDGLIAPNDALGVINTLNTPDTIPTGVTHKFDKLVVTLDRVPSTLDGKIREVKDTLVATQKEMDQTYDVLRAELDEFLEFSIDQQVALEKRFDDLEASMDFSFKVMEREIRETAEEFSKLDTSLFENLEFDDSYTQNETEEGQLIFETDHPNTFDFLTNEFSWHDVENLGDGLEALFSDLEEVVDTVETFNPADLLTPELQNWLSDFDTGDATLADFVAGQIDTVAAEDWLLLGGDDVAELVDAMQADLADNEAGFMKFVDEYFNDDTAFLDLVDELMEECVSGEMHHQDQVAVGGETTGSIVVVDENTSFELDLHDNPHLLAIAEALHEQPVMIFGTLERVEGVEIPERTIMDVKKIIPKEKFTDLTTKFTEYNYPVFDSIAGKFEEIYVDNVDHYADVIADIFLGGGAVLSSAVTA